MNLNYLETLLAVQEQGSFSAAARQKGITQPAISLQIQALEADVGTQLVARDARTCELTPAGLALAEFAVDVFERLRQTRILLSQLTGEVSGAIRLGASNIPGEYILPPLLAQFLQLYPQVKFSLEIGDSEQIHNWLDNKHIDFGIVGQRQDDAKYEYSPLANDELLLVVPAEHPWAGQEIAPTQLHDYPFVDREPGSGTRANYDKALREIGIEPNSLNSVFNGGSTSSVLSAVLAGMGYAFCSKWALRNGLALGQLATARVTGLSMKRGFDIVTNPNRFRTVAADELQRFLRRQGATDRGGEILD